MGLTKTFWKYYREQFLRDNKKAPATGNLVLIITSRCNFACRHCLRDSDLKSDMKFELAQKAILGVKRYNFANIALTGGEPLLYPDLTKLLEFIEDNGFSFSIVTNGYNFMEFADLLKKHRESIFFIAFSLESTDRKKHDTIRRAGSFDRLLEDFRFCRDAKIPFRVLTAVSTVNYDEIFELGVFAKKKGARALAMTTVLPCTHSDENKLVLDEQKREELYAVLRQLPQILKLPVHIAADIRTCGNIKLCAPLSMAEITVDSQGNLVQCCELANYDSDSVRQNAIITSIRDKSFDDAMKEFSEYVHRFDCMRIDDYKTQGNLSGVDFNSCFYCLSALKTKHS